LVFFVVLWDFFSRFTPNYHLICSGLIVSALLIAVLLGIGLLNGDQGVGVWKLPIPHWGTLHVNDNIRRLGYLFETAIVASLCFLTRKGWRFVTGILIAILAFFLLWLGGRASILGVVAGTGFYLVMETGNRKKSLKFLAWILLMLFLIWIVFHIRIPGLEKIGTTIVERTMEAPTLDQMSTGRLSLWSLILEEWGRSPWVGTGPQSCFFYPGRGEKIIHAHNFVLQFLGEWGILGASLFLLLLAGTLRRGWSLYRDDFSSTRLVRLTALSLFLALSATGLFGGTYFFAQTSLYLLIAYALWASTPSPDAGAPQ
jgi:O-antigen ligase